jgi:hypothetical protein
MTDEKTERPAEDTCTGCSWCSMPERHLTTYEPKRWSTNQGDAKGEAREATTGGIEE